MTKAIPSVTTIGLEKKSEHLTHHKDTIVFRDVIPTLINDWYDSEFVCKFVDVFALQ